MVKNHTIIDILLFYSIAELAENAVGHNKYYTA